MPIYRATQQNFDGKTAATGLFDAAKTTGSDDIQVRLNSIMFTTEDSLTSWSVFAEDPLDGTQVQLLTGSQTQLACGGPAGFMVLPTNDDGAPWRISFVATGMDGPGTLSIDYDFMRTEG